MLYSLKKSIKLRFLYNNVEKSKFFKNILLKNDFFFLIYTVLTDLRIIFLFLK